MRRNALRTSRRAGVVLDLVVGAALLILGAFVLASVGLTFQQVLHGALHFFGLG